MFGEYICSDLDREVRGLKYFSKSHLFLAIKLQPDLNIRVILQVASFFKK